MKKSELKRLVTEVMGEMFDPYADTTYGKSVTKISNPKDKAVLEHSMGALRVAHKVLTKQITASYGDRFNNIEVSMKIGSDGVPHIQIYGSPKNSKHDLGGTLDIQYPKPF